MNVTAVRIYCLPNIRAPWVVVFDPHPWGHGALRVREDKAVLVYERAASTFERLWLADAGRHYCVTFRTVDRLLDYEDGQHEHVQEVREAIDVRRQAVAAVMAEIKRKQEKLKKKRRRVPLAVVQPPTEENP